VTRFIPDNTYHSLEAVKFGLDRPLMAPGGRLQSYAPLAANLLASPIAPAGAIIASALEFWALTWRQSSLRWLKDAPRSTSRVV